MYLRRLILHFERLSFSDAASISLDFKDYVNSGRSAMDKLLPLEEQILDMEVGDKDDETLGDVSMELSAATDADVAGDGEEEGKKMYSRKQAEFYIARQVRENHWYGLVKSVSGLTIF